MAIIGRDTGLMAAHVSDAMPARRDSGSQSTHAKAPASLLPLIIMAAGCWGLVAWVVSIVF